MQAVRIPHEHVNDDSVLLVKWLVEPGQQVESGQPIVTIETSKATMNLEAPRAGYAKFDRSEGTEVDVGGVLYYIADNADDPIPEVSSEDEAAPVTKDRTLPISKTRFSRKALELIEEHGLTKEHFAAKGLVKAVDVLKMADATSEAPPGEESNSVGASLSKGVPVRVEKLKRQKRLEARYLTGGQNEITSFVSVICSTRGLKAAAQQHPELGGGPLSLVVHETARLLKKYPIFNAYHYNGHVHYYEQVNIGFALDAERGLKVPVIVEADQKTVAEITMKIEDLVADYLDDTLKLQSLEGGTFTISDLSGEGVKRFAPLINQKQAAILGIAAESFELGGDQGAFELVLVFDHRLAEGRGAACFLDDLRGRIESYERALTGVDNVDPTCARCLRPVSELQKLNIPLLQEIGPTGKTKGICANCFLGY